MISASAMLICVATLTGHPIPDAELRWVEMPVEIIVDVAQASNLPDAYQKRALYFKPDTVWVAPGYRYRLAGHEITHHFQFHAGAHLTRSEMEKQAECVGAMQPWCADPPKGYCK